MTSKNLFLILVLTAASVFAAPANKPKQSDILTWPRSGAAAFGCFLEKSFAHKDAKFHCGLKKYVNKGDPCKNTDAYYEGPAFPAAKARELGKDVEEIQLSWERGKLQNVSVTLKGKIAESEVRKRFRLPASGSSVPGRENVMSASVQECGKDKTCLVLQGFDHMGAGDVECP